jgi:hypothetical protein
MAWSSYTIVYSWVSCSQCFSNTYLSFYYADWMNLELLSLLYVRHARFISIEKAPPPDSLPIYQAGLLNLNWMDWPNWIQKVRLCWNGQVWNGFLAGMVPFSLRWAMAKRPQRATWIRRLWCSVYALCLASGWSVQQMTQWIILRPPWCYIYLGLVA